MTPLSKNTSPSAADQLIFSEATCAAPLRPDGGLKRQTTIRYSAAPHEELKLEGSNSELSNLRAAILAFCESSEPVLSPPADSEFDPSPYQSRLGSLFFYTTTDPILISVASGRLSIAGKAESLRLFAENLPYDARHTSSVPYHVHFDRLGREDHMSEASLGIVLGLRK
jgi:hypothetical protein